MGPTLGLSQQQQQQQRSQQQPGHNNGARAESWPGANKYPGAESALNNLNKTGLVKIKVQDFSLEESDV